MNGLDIAVLLANNNLNEKVFKEQWCTFTNKFRPRNHGHKVYFMPYIIKSGDTYLDCDTNMFLQVLYETDNGYILTIPNNAPDIVKIQKTFKKEAIC